MSDIPSGGALTDNQELSTRGLHGSGAVAFSTRGEYGVRFMVALARMDHGEPVSLTDIAEQEDLPRAYLEQIIGGLRDAGIIDSQRGAHGGYRLARPANEVRMGASSRRSKAPSCQWPASPKRGAPAIAPAAAP